MAEQFFNPCRKIFTPDNMGFVKFFASLLILKLFSCAEVSPEKDEKDVKPLSLDDMCPLILKHIGSYVDNPYASMAFLNRYFYSVFSIDYPVKRFFNERFNMPEFVTEDVDDNEGELKLLLDHSRFIRYNNPRHVYLAFRDELINGTKLNRLIPHFMNFSCRINRNVKTSYSTYEVLALVKRKGFDLLFKDNARLFHRNSSFVLFEYECIQSFQEYILNNPTHLGHVPRYFRNYLQDVYYIRPWIVNALISNLPDKFIFVLPEYMVLFFNSNLFWSETYFPKEMFPILFSRINNILDRITPNYKRSTSDRIYYLLNRIRFGTEDSGFYEKENLAYAFDPKKVELMCRCASLSDKKELFSKLIGHFDLNTKLYKLNQNAFESKYLPITMHKLLFDVHEMPSILVDRASFYAGTNFLEIVSKYCRIVSIEWDGCTVRIQFKSPYEAIAYGIPEIVNIQRKFEERSLLLNYLFTIPEQMIFDNAEVFEKFLMLFLNEYFDKAAKIRSENLRYIAQSEHLIQLLRERNDPDNPIFIASLLEIFQFIDEPFSPLTDIVDPFDSRCSALMHYKSENRLLKLETHFGVSIADCLNSGLNYFDYRHVFKYLIKNRKDLPANLSNETKQLLEIDFPQLKFT